MDVRVLTGLVCPADQPPARPLGRRKYPGALKFCGVKNGRDFTDQFHPLIGGHFTMRVAHKLLLTCFIQHF